MAALIRSDVLVLVSLISVILSVPVESKMLGVWGDGMVLQHDEPVVHGCVDAFKAGTTATMVVVSTFNSASGEKIGDNTATVDQAGCFRVSLSPQPPATSASATVKLIVTINGQNYASSVLETATDVLFGTVILCAGQSNMVHPVSYDWNATEQIAALVALPNLRLFQVGRQWAAEGEVNEDTLALGCDNITTPPLTPGCEVRNIWRQPSVSASSFSAVCAFTVLETMRNEASLGLTAAVGLVENDWGGSDMHTWVPKRDLVGAQCKLNTVVPDGNCSIHTQHISPIKNNDYGCLFRGMVAPLTPSLRVKFVLWYQGEADAGGPHWPTGGGDSIELFTCVFTAMIATWRTAFDTPSLPFFWVQLAPWPTKAPVANDFAHVRVAQANTLATTNVTGMAVTHDIGDVGGGVHPHNKTEVGRRLSYAVRRVVYADPQPPALTLVDSISMSGVISFQNATSLWWGVTQNCTHANSPAGCEGWYSGCDLSTMVVEVCSSTSSGASEDCLDTNPNVTWTKIQAPVGQNGVEVDFTPPESVQTMVVRYAWSNAPKCVLFDQNNLPISPFHQPAI